MKILDFFKALVMPRQMRRFRYMSVFFAICIFILSMYAIIIPTKVYYDNNTHKLVEENDLYYLHSLKNIPTVDEKLDDFVSQIKDKKLSCVEGVCSAAKLGLEGVNVDNTILGVIETKDNHIYFNNKYYDITASGEKITINPSDGKIIIWNVTDKPIDVTGVTPTDEIELITITVNNRSKLMINGENTDILVNDNYPLLSVKDGFLYCGDNKTTKEITGNKKVIIEVVPNLSCEYYENTYTYTDSNNVTNHVKFIIDLSVSSINEITFKYDEATYPDIQNGAYYFIEISKYFVFYQANPSGIEELKITRNEVTLQSIILATYFANSPINTEDFTTETFGSYFLGKLEEGYKVLAVQSFNITTFIYCIIFTFVVTLLFFLLFKRNGRLKTLKEYYNIAAIANIVPTFVCFVIAWFNPILFGSIYLFMFAIYYLFVLYRINNAPELV